MSNADPCPGCGAEYRPYSLDGPYDCDTVIISGHVMYGKECLRRQLTRANAHNAQMRAALEDLANRAERARRVLQESGRREGLRPDQCGWGVLDTTAARAALAALDREEGAS